MKTFDHLTISIPKATQIIEHLQKHVQLYLFIVLVFISISNFFHYYQNGLGLSYNDARSHLDIGRRVVEGLKPGLAQLGSVWLPLNHLVMVPFIWNDWMWHSGFAGAIQSMVGFVATGMLIFAFLHHLKVGLLGKLVGVSIFVANLNILYLQSTAMSELLLIATMTAGAYELVGWHKTNNFLYLIRSAFWIMLATLTRYDGWFLLAYAAGLVMLHTIRTIGYKKIEGVLILFLTLASFGVVLWFLWNLLIFKDPLYFAFGPFSAHSQQQQLDQAGVLATKGNWLLSLKVYGYALFYNTYTIPALLALMGVIRLIFDKTLSVAIRTSTTALLAPFYFNVLALYLGFSVLFIQGISGDTWFNVRYGIMLMPTIAIYIGYLIDRAKPIRLLLIGILIFVITFAFLNKDSVAIDDARVGSSQKNVSEVSGYLNKYAKNEKGFILISAASHDAIIFSSGLPMKRFIHEGTGLYWENALAIPDRWARWIVVRTHDENDLTWKGIRKAPGFLFYDKVAAYPFADVYELQASHSANLNTEPVLGKQK